MAPPPPTTPPRSGSGLTSRRAVAWAAVLASSGVAVSSLAGEAGGHREVSLEPARVAVGAFAPPLGVPAGRPAPSVAPFWMDRRAVDNAAFLAFVRRHPTWARARVSPTLADARYLAGWPAGVEGPSAALPAALGRAPVVWVSWFAARAYCADRGGRLPTVLEWEAAAAADETHADASHDPAFLERILRWYGRPVRDEDLTGDAGSPPNLWGLRGLHGLIWEWTSDFSGVPAGDARAGGERSPGLVCGAGAATAADRQNYAAFMRYALRGSLHARDTTARLGFRCVYDRDGAWPEDRP